VLALLELWLGRWEAGPDNAVLHEAYVNRCATLGRRIEIQLGGGRVVTGQATGIDDDGRLVLRTAEGERVFGAGDVVHLR
jgi:BirA family biotin operon repressor/biotin-[acetyl-CoA-carboxylase] ligase